MTEKLDPKSAEDILKKYDKESDTMMYKGVMAKIVSAIAITFSIFQLYTATFGVLDRAVAASRPSGIRPGARVPPVPDAQVVVALQGTSL